MFLSCRRLPLHPALLRTMQFFGVAVFISAMSTALYAGQEKLVVGISADVNGGAVGPNISGVDLSLSPGRYVSYVGSSPSISLKAHGEHASLSSSYAFGFNSYNSDPSSRSNSHAALVAITNEFGPKWNLSLSDSFSMTSDISTFHLLSGLTPIPDQFEFSFNPVIAKSSRNNSASVGVNQVLSKTSSMTYGVSHSLVSYGDDPKLNGVLSDQQRISASVGYSRSSERNTWSLGYSGAQFIFTSFQNSRTHSVSVGFSRRLSQMLSMHISGGPAYAQTTETVRHTLGANASFGLQRTVRNGSFSFNVSQSGSDASGLGSVSTNRQVGVGVTRTFGRSISLALDVAGLDSKENNNRALATRSVTAGGSIGYSFARRWSVNWGGQYQRYEGNSLFGFDQKRIFAALRYSNPEVWRF